MTVSSVTLRVSDIEKSVVNSAVSLELNEQWRHPTHENDGGAKCYQNDGGVDCLCLLLGYVGGNSRGYGGHSTLRK